VNRLTHFDNKFHDPEFAQVLGRGLHAPEYSGSFAAFSHEYSRVAAAASLNDPSGRGTHERSLRAGFGCNAGKALMFYELFHTRHYTQLIDDCKFLLE
jgi:hypothetical protein